MLNLKKVYNLIIDNKFDDTVSIADADTIKELRYYENLVYYTIDKIKEYVLNESKTIIEKYSIEVGNLDNSLAGRIAAENKLNTLFTYIMKYIRSGNIDETFKVLPSTNNFRTLYNYARVHEHIEEDYWDFGRTIKQKVI